MLVKKYSQSKLHILALILMSLILMSGVFLSAYAIYAEEVDGETVAETTAEPSLTEKAGMDQQAIDELNRQIEEQRKKIDELADKIGQYQDNIKAVRNEAVSLQNEIYIVDNQAAKTSLDIEAKEEEIKATELEIEKVGLEIKANEILINRDKSKLSAFIRQLDIYDEKDYLTVLLSNNSFSDFFDQVKHLEGVQNDLQSTLNRVQELIAKLGKNQENLSNQRDKLSELLNKLEEEKLGLVTQKGTKNYLIAKTKQSESEYQKLISSLQQEQIAVNGQMSSLERKLREELEKGGENEQFNSLADASLRWPVSNPRITAYFHDPDYPYRNLFEHSGLDMGVPAGTPVMATEAGYVAKVALGTQWYGNYVMIIHSNNLATLYAHLSSVSVKADQYVYKGQVIAASGSTGFSSGPHLHLEVRLNGIPVNPLNYLP